LNKNPTRWLTQRPAVLLGLSLVVLWACFFGVGTTAYAASSALPGDPLYSLKTVVESVRAELTLDSAHQARLYMDFAGRRLVEMQALMQDHRFADMDRAVRAYAMDLEMSLGAVETAAQNQPGGAVALRQETLTILQTYSRILAGLLAGAPSEARSGIQNAIQISATASTVLDERLGDDDDGDDGNLGGRGTDEECPTYSAGSHDDDCETPRREVGETDTPAPQPSAIPSNNSHNNDDGANSGGDDDAGRDDGGRPEGGGEDDGDEEGEDDDDD
jgi:hypothetical protein